MLSYYTDVRCTALTPGPARKNWVRIVKSLLPSSRSTTVLFLSKVLNPLLLQWSYSDDRSHCGCTKLPPGVNVYSCVCNCDQKNKTKKKTLSETSLFTTINRKSSKKEESKVLPTHRSHMREWGLCDSKRLTYYTKKWTVFWKKLTKALIICISILMKLLVDDAKWWYWFVCYHIGSDSRN